MSCFLSPNFFASHVNFANLNNCLCYAMVTPAAKTKKELSSLLFFSLFSSLACLTKLVVCILTKWKLVLITVICHRNGDNTVRSKNTKKSHKMCMACLSSTTVSSDVLLFSFATFFCVKSLRPHSKLLLCYFWNAHCTVSHFCAKLP